MDPFLGEIIMFGGNFAPRSWAFCDGQLLPINTNQALFSILGTIYGGDGRTTFALPDLRGRVAMHPGNGPGLSSRRLGQKGGVESVTLNVTQIPSHTHTGMPVTGNVLINVNNSDGDSNTPNGNYIAKHPTSNGFSTSVGEGRNPYLNGVSHNLTSAVANTGGNQSHTNMQPFTCINYIIALQGVFPSRS